MSETKKRFITDDGRELRVVRFVHEDEGVEWNEYAVYDGSHAVYDGFDTMAEAVEVARMEAREFEYVEVDVEAQAALRASGIDRAIHDIATLGGWYARNVADSMLDEIADGESMSDFADGYVSAVEAMDGYIRRDR